MTTEEIEMRRGIKEMLSDVGINRETLKQAVKDILEEKINKAIVDAMHETSGGSTVKDKINDYVARHVRSFSFDAEFRSEVEKAVKKEMQDFRISVEIKRETQNEKD